MNAGKAWAGVARGQEVDVTQTPNAENAHIRKSYPEEIGQGRGNLGTPNASLYLISRDPFRSIRIQPDPGDPRAADFPQKEHGSIKLSVLFNDPTGLE